MKLVDAENILDRLPDDLPYKSSVKRVLIQAPEINSERKYVIVCNEHKAMLKDTLLFWGSLTDDNAKRSFGGYTCQIDKCERYTRQELEEWRGDLKKEYPFFDELKNATDFFRSDEVLISIDDLKNKLRYRELLVMTR